MLLWESEPDPLEDQLPRQMSWCGSSMVRDGGVKELLEKFPPYLHPPQGHFAHRYAGHLRISLFVIITDLNSTLL